MVVKSTILILALAFPSIYLLLKYWRGVEKLTLSAGIGILFSVVCATVYIILLLRSSNFY